MANAWYPIYKQNLLAGTAGYNLTADTVQDGPYCTLINTAIYTFNAGHTFYDSGGANDVTDAKVGVDQRIVAPTVAAANFDGGDLVFPTVVGATVSALGIYRHGAGPATTWPMVLYMDSLFTGLPVVPNGGNITITWNASGIAVLSDARAKQDIRQVARASSGLGIYEFRYLGSARLRRGLIAQEVLLFRPEAVLQGRDGLLRVDYERALGVDYGRAP